MKFLHQQNRVTMLVTQAIIPWCLGTPEYMDWPQFCKLLTANFDFWIFFQETSVCFQNGHQDVLLEMFPNGVQVILTHIKQVEEGM